MQKNEAVSVSVVKRLPRYYRFLGELLGSGVTRISSRELSERMGLTASQIRQDLNHFGGFGQQGYGYHVEALYSEIGNILGLNHGYKTILVGVGNLGRAIATHISFETKGCRLIGLFDSNPHIIGEMVNDIIISDVRDLERFCREEQPVIAVLCIPKQATRDITQKLIDCGVRAFWNFSHYDIALGHPNVVVENVHLGDSLMTLTYGVKNNLRQTP